MRAEAVIKTFALVLSISFPALASAEFSSLSDDELSSVDGAGIGLVLEDFLFDHGNDQSNGQVFKITGIKSTAPSREDVVITVSQLYISGSGSNYGKNLSTVNLGRLVNPFKIDVIDGAPLGIGNKAVLEFAAPTKVSESSGLNCLDAGAGSGRCSSRVSERPDIGVKLGVAVGSKTPHNVNIHAKSAVFDGSYLRLWGDDDQRQLVAEYKLNFYTPELSINSCDPSGQNCGSTIYMKNFELELALGNRFQPMHMNVNGDGNFTYEIKAIAHQFMNQLPTSGKCDASNPCGANAKAAHTFFKNYYTNDDFRSNLRIGNLSIGDVNATGRDFGSARIEGMLIQYLKVTSHDLAL